MKFQLFIALAIAASHAMARDAGAELIGTFGPITISATHQPTPQRPGFSTWTVSASGNLPLYDFEFATYPTGLYPGYGFHGPMNQVNPAGVSTIFQDANAAFPFVGANPLQDSQFLVLSSDIDRPANTSFESADLLSAAFGRLNHFGTNVDFAQIVKPDDSAVTFLGRIYFGPPIPPVFAEVRGTLGLVPEPPRLILILPAAIAATTSQRRRPTFRKRV
jgi:hypothetical protein